MLVFKVIFYISLFIIFWANIGYPFSILILGKIKHNNKNDKDYSYEPTVTIMVVAHNEEKVILNKLNNLKEINYPKDKIEILVASDNSTDATNNIVENYIQDNPEVNIKLYKAKNRMGKTNAQNEAQKIVTTEFLVMTDANAILAPNSIKELMASFTSDEISYVTGKLSYTNEDASGASQSETSYWNLDLKIREIESSIQTITAGNGALYACRNSEYVDFDPIKSHGSSMPIYFALQGKKQLQTMMLLHMKKLERALRMNLNEKLG